MGILAWWALGYSLAYGTHGTEYSGNDFYFLKDAPMENYPMFFFQWTFAATATTIVSGAMAGRTHVVGYLAYSIVLTGWVYPTIVHWTWSDDAWLTKGEDDPSRAGAGYSDFAGSGIVHACGGTAALVGAIIVGPRKGYQKESAKY